MRLATYILQAVTAGAESEALYTRVLQCLCDAHLLSSSSHAQVLHDALSSSSSTSERLLLRLAVRALGMSDCDEKVAVCRQLRAVARKS